MKIGRPMQAIEVDMICDACNNGAMRPTGKQLLTQPPKIEHKCTGCGDKRFYTEAFPQFGYIPMVNAEGKEATISLGTTVDVEDQTGLIVTGK